MHTTLTASSPVTPHASDVEPVAPLTPDATSRSVEYGDFLIDAETGEVLGLRTPAPQEESADGQFHIRTQADAEWVLRRLLDAEAEIGAENAKLEAIGENFMKIIGQIRSRKNYLEWRFGAELEEFARRQLADGKRKTWICPYGRIAFRRTPATVKIEDMESAVTWANNAGLAEKIKMVLRVNVSDVKDIVLGLPRDQVPGCFSITLEQERCTIKTLGVE